MTGKGVRDAPYPISDMLCGFLLMVIYGECKFMMERRYEMVNQHSMGERTIMTSQAIYHHAAEGIQGIGFIFTQAVIFWMNWKVPRVCACDRFYLVHSPDSLIVGAMAPQR